MNPRRYPRTLEEAFGPYQRGGLHELYTPMTLAEKIIFAVYLILGVAILAAMFAGVL